MTELVDKLRTTLAGRYTIDRILGTGGMSTVYLAEDLKHRRKVALKVLRPELSVAGGADRFLREIQIAAQLNHPHILPLLDSGEAGDHVYYAMPYVDGESLRDRLKREGELNLTEAVRLIRDVVDALEYAHGAGVVHRDIKPDNVMIAGRHALVVDFGVAKALTEAAGDLQLTTAGMAIGTPSYMAPEQAAGEATIDHRADIYAVGALAYELVAGRPPFQGTSARQILAAQVLEIPTPVAQYRPAVSPDLAAVIMRCLEKKPADRWQSTRELLSQLEAFTTSDGITLISATQRRHAARHVNPRAATAGLVIAAVLAIALIFSPGGPTRTLEHGRIVVVPFRNQTGDSSLNDIGRMTAEWVTNGLHRQEIGEAVPAATVTRLLGSIGDDEPDPTSAIADFADAGIIVSGSFYRDGDTLVFGSEVIDARTGRLIGAIDPVRGPETMMAIGLVRERLLGLIAAHLGVAELAAAQTPPPRLEVYRQWFAGFTAMSRGDLSGASEHFERISQLDSTFFAHYSFVGAIHYWNERYAEAEAVLRGALRVPERMTPFERASIEHILAWVTGDLEAEYRTAKARGVLDPTVAYSVANGALRNNRPTEALREFAAVDLNSPFSSNWTDLWGVATESHHLLGDHITELAVAAEAVRRFPGDIQIATYEARALAALGRGEDVRQRIAASTGFEASTAYPAPLYTLGWMGVLAALELRAHGSAAAVDGVIQASLDWYRRALTRVPGDEGLEFGQATAMYVAGRWGDAGAAFLDLNRRSPTNPDYLGFLGVIAARAGQRDRANDILDQLEAMDDAYLYGRHTRWRARINALLGNDIRALGLLQEAFAEGMSLGMGQHWIWLHIDPDLDGLRPDQEFQRWIAPRDR